MEKHHQVMMLPTSSSTTPFSSDFKVDYINNSTVHVENDEVLRKAIISSSAQNEREKEIRQRRYVFQTKSPVDVLDDGYQWRKYGKKIVKNNKFPRSYYKCSHRNCDVKKQIQRHPQDEQIVVTTYEGTHTHPVDKSTESFDQILGNLLITNLICDVPPALE